MLFAQARPVGSGVGPGHRRHRRLAQETVAFLAVLGLMTGSGGCATSDPRAIRQLRASRLEVLADLRAALVGLRGIVRIQSFDDAGYTYCGPREGIRKYEVDGVFASAERSPDLRKTLTTMAESLKRAGWRTHDKWEGIAFTFTRGGFSAEFYLIDKENSGSPVAIGMKAAGSCFAVGSTGDELVGRDDVRPFLGL